MARINLRPWATRPHVSLQFLRTGANSSSRAHNGSYAGCAKQTAVLAASSKQGGLER